MKPQPKQVRVELPEYLDFVRSLPCPCGAPAPSQAHHYPPKGRRGDVDDTRTLPVCVECHQRCHEIIVAKNGKRLLPIPADQQTAAADATLRRFLLEASSTALGNFLAALIVRRD